MDNWGFVDNFPCWRRFCRWLAVGWISGAGGHAVLFRVGLPSGVVFVWVLLVWGCPAGRASSPEGQVSGMAGVCVVFLRLCAGLPAIPSTSLRTITVRRGSLVSLVCRDLACLGLPHRTVIGLRQVDGMAGSPLWSAFAGCGLSSTSYPQHPWLSTAVPLGPGIVGGLA